MPYQIFLLCEREVIADGWSLILLLTTAVWFDCREDRIPNELIYIGITGWLLVILQTKTWNPICDAGKQMLLVFLVSYPLFKIGALGAGDIKLLMMCACFLYQDNILECFGMSLVLGAGIGLVKLWKEDIWVERFSYFSSYIREVIGKKKWLLYESDTLQTIRLAKNLSHMQKHRIHFSLPIFVGVALKLVKLY